MNFFKAVVSLILVSAVISQANGQATVQHYWNFEGDFDDQVGMADGSVTGNTTVTFDFFIQENLEIIIIFKRL